MIGIRVLPVLGREVLCKMATGSNGASAPPERTPFRTSAEPPTFASAPEPGLPSPIPVRRSLVAAAPATRRATATDRPLLNGAGMLFTGQGHIRGRHRRMSQAPAVVCSDLGARGARHCGEKAKEKALHGEVLIGLFPASREIVHAKWK